MIFLDSYQFKIDRPITKDEYRRLHELYFIEWVIEKAGNSSIVCINRDRLIEEMIHNLKIIDADHEIRFCLQSISESLIL